MASPSRYRAAGTCVPCSATCTWYASLRGAYRSVSSAVLYPARGKRQKMRIFAANRSCTCSHRGFADNLCVSLPHICRVSPPGFGIFKGGLECFVHILAIILCYHFTSDEPNKTNKFYFLSMYLYAIILTPSMVLLPPIVFATSNHDFPSMYRYLNICRMSESSTVQIYLVSRLY